MKSIIFGLLVALSANSYAFNYGLFKVKVTTGYFDAEEVTFLLNSIGKVKMLENESYYSIETQSYFGKTTLNITSGGDEDYVKAIITLEDNKALEACSALFDGPGANLSFLGNQGVKLQRWNKSTKKFETLNKDLEQNQSCKDRLTKGYEDFEVY